MDVNEKKQVLAMKVRVTAENFQREVLKEDIPVLVEFFAGWCSKCAMMEETVDEVSRACQKVLKVCQVEIDESPELAEEFQVEAVPAFVIFKGGKPVSVAAGVSDREVILDMLRQETGLQV